MRLTYSIQILLCLVFGLSPLYLSAQETTLDPSATPEETPVTAEAGPDRSTLVNKKFSVDSSDSRISPDITVEEVLWNFGDGTRVTGEKVTHSYARPGNYTIKLSLTTSAGKFEDTTTIDVFDRVMVLLADESVSEDQLNLFTQQASEEELMLLPLKPKNSGPEAVLEEELTQQLIASREDISQADIIVSWTAGSVGGNALSKFAQYIKQADEFSFRDLNIENKGIIILSNTPFPVLAPSAQTTFDQLSPQYVLLARPNALPLLFAAQTADEARGIVINAHAEHRLLGTFSSRATSNLNPTNFMSYGLSYLVNHGIPINNILLILTIPVIATILAFARQVIGLKAFGMITPAMTTLVFLVMGLQAGLLVFVVVLLSGTLTRFLLRHFHLLYLPRMALILTTASLASLLMFGVSAATNSGALVSFSIFPILILIILAEEFISVQFTRGVRTAMRITAWTLFLSIISYYIVSWEILRTLLLSYPETVLLAIPANIALGRFSGLRLVEYIRFRELLRYGHSAE